MSISPAGVDPVPLSGTAEVSPSETNHYILTAVNEYGQRTSSVIAVVGQAPTIDSFTVDPEFVPVGEPCTFSWSTSGADTVRIDPDIGEVGNSGSRIITLTSTGTYTLTAENIYGTATATVTVSVGSQPVVSITASPNPINEGDGTTFPGHPRMPRA